MTTSAPVLAEELFGSGAGVKLEFGKPGFAPVYKLIYKPKRDAQKQNRFVNPIEDGDEGTIKYALDGAVFAQRVSPNDFAITNGNSVGTLEIRGGGAKYDSWVSVDVSAATNWATLRDANNASVEVVITFNLTFNLPDLTATERSANKPVRVSSGFSTSRRSNFPEGTPTNATCDEDGDFPRGCKVVSFSPYITDFTLDSPATGRIDLMNRAKLIAGGGNVADIEIGTVTVFAAAQGTIKDRDGDPINAFTGDLLGDIDISVASTRFRDGDVVYIDDNGSKAPDGPRDKDGAGYFSDVGMEIAENSTTRLDQAGVSKALGLDDGWSGRLSCRVLATAPISIQVLTRASDVLVNNTYVGQG